MTDLAGSIPQQLTIQSLQVNVGGHLAVGDVSLVVQPGSVHCLTGDSGSGKTLTSLAAVGLLPTGATTAGSIQLSGLDDDLLGLDQRSWSSIRGRSIGYVGQNALGCLHPAFRVGAQIVEAIRRHRPMPRSEALALAVEELAAVDLDNPEKVSRPLTSGTRPLRRGRRWCDVRCPMTAELSKPTGLLWFRRFGGAVRPSA